MPVTEMGSSPFYSTDTVNVFRLLVTDLKQMRISISKSAIYRACLFVVISSACVFSVLNHTLQIQSVSQ